MDECGGWHQCLWHQWLTGDSNEVTATDDSTGKVDGWMAADGDNKRMTHVSDDR
jgi:hypothetical protein